MSTESYSKVSDNSKTVDFGNEPLPKQLPPLDHQKAQQIGESKRIFSYLQLPLWADASKYADLGPGYTAYFRFQEYILFMLIVGTFIFGIPGLVINFRSGHFNGQDVGGSYNLLSIGNQTTMDQAYITGHVFFILVTMYLTYALRKMLKEEMSDLEKEFLTSADYCVRLHGLPEDACDPLEIQAFCDQWGPVHSVTISFQHTSQIMKLRKSIEHIHEAIEIIGLEILRMQQAGKTKGFSLKLKARKRRNLLKKRTDMEQKLENEWEFLRNAGLKNSGTAFVVFEYSKSAAKCIKDLPSGWSGRFQSFGGFGFLFGGGVSKYFRGQCQLDARRAPEPEDVNWEDVGIMREQKKIRNYLSFFGVVVTCGIAFGILFPIYGAQINQAKSTSANHVTRTVVSQVISKGIEVMNWLGTFSVSSLLAFEAHFTKSGLLFNQFFKSFLIDFTNTALSPFFSFVTTQPAYLWYFSGGCMQQAMSSMINVCATGAPQLFIMTWVSEKYMKKRRAASAVTQKQLEKSYEPPVFDVRSRYRFLVFNVMLCIFYAVPLPFGIVLCTITAACQVALDRYLLLRVCKAPEVEPDPKLAYNAFTMIAIMGIINVYMAGIFYFIRPSTTGNSQQGTWNAVTIYMSSLTGFIFFYGFSFFCNAGSLAKRITGGVFNVLFGGSGGDDDAADNYPWTEVDQGILTEYVPPMVLYDIDDDESQDREGGQAQGEESKKVSVVVDNDSAYVAARSLSPRSSKAVQEVLVELQVRSFAVFTAKGEPYQAPQFVGGPGYVEDEESDDGEMSRQGDTVVLVPQQQVFMPPMMMVQPTMQPTIQISMGMNGQQFVVMNQAQPQMVLVNQSGDGFLSLDYSTPAQETDYAEAVVEESLQDLHPHPLRPVTDARNQCGYQGNTVSCDVCGEQNVLRKFGVVYHCYSCQDWDVCRPCVERAIAENEGNSSESEADDRA